MPARFGDGLDPVFIFSLSNTGPFLALFDPSGAGSTVPAPILVPPGFAFYGVGVSFTTVGGVLLGELTDAEFLVVQ